MITVDLPQPKRTIAVNKDSLQIVKQRVNNALHVKPPIHMAASPKKVNVPVVRPPIHMGASPRKKPQAEAKDSFNMPKSKTGEEKFADFPILRKRKRVRRKLNISLDDFQFSDDDPINQASDRDDASDDDFKPKPALKKDDSEESDESETSDNPELEEKLYQRRKAKAQMYHQQKTRERCEKYMNSSNTTSFNTNAQSMTRPVQNQYQISNNHKKADTDDELMNTTITRPSYKQENRLNNNATPVRKDSTLIDESFSETAL